MLDRKEVLRYLGCRTEDALLERMAVQAEKLVLQAAAPVHVFRRTAIPVSYTHLVCSLRGASLILGISE